MPFSDFLAGRHYSVLNNRKKGKALFQNFLNYDAPIKDILMSLGIYSYLDIDNIIDEPPVIKKPKFIGDTPEIKTVPIIVSVDINYLRKYGPQLFVTCIALKSYAFHIHVIGNYDEVLNAIDDAKILFNKMVTFYDSKKTIIKPTFSTEEIPEFVKESTTYYACSRFIHADKFIEWFDSDILIIDVDFLFTDDIKNMLKVIEKYDISLTITTDFAAMTPWTRAMGCTLYLKNNINAKDFALHTKKYISYGLLLDNSWTLDQNALCYATEKAIQNKKNVNLFSIPYNIRPLKQFRIRYFMEERF